MKIQRPRKQQKERKEAVVLLTPTQAASYTTVGCCRGILLLPAKNWSAVFHHGVNQGRILFSVDGIKRMEEQPKRVPLAR